MDYVGMNNWEHVHRFSAVCKSWQLSSLPYLSQIGIAPMDGGEDHKLNVPAFLRYLELEKFYHVQCIYRLVWAKNLTPPASYCDFSGAIFEVTLFFFESYYIPNSHAI
jgi:hypothetical protein